MMISGRTLCDHIRLLTPLFGVIAAVFALRFLLGFLGAPRWMLGISSVSIVVPLCVVLATIMIHSRRFGGYGSVILATVCLVVWSQLLIASAILFTVLTGIVNVYTFPEYSMRGADPNHIRHITGHLTFGIGIETLLGSVLSCILLYMLRRTGPHKKDRTQAR